MAEIFPCLGIQRSIHRKFQVVDDMVERSTDCRRHLSASKDNMKLLCTFVASIRQQDAGTRGRPQRALLQPPRLDELLRAYPSVLIVNSSQPEALTDQLSSGLS